MHEKRNYFRVKNNGQIRAACGMQQLEVIDISSSGILIKKNTQLAPTGTLDLTIQYASMKIHYELLRVLEDTMVLVFNNKTENEELFVILKKLKDEHQT